MHTCSPEFWRSIKYYRHTYICTLTWAPCHTFRLPNSRNCFDNEQLSQDTDTDKSRGCEYCIIGLHIWMRGQFKQCYSVADTLLHPECSVYLVVAQRWYRVLHTVIMPISSHPAVWSGGQACCQMTSYCCPYCSGIKAMTHTPAVCHSVIQDWCLYQHANC